MALHHFSGRYQLEQTACSPLSSLVRPSLSSGMDSMVGGRGRPVISHGMAKRGRKAYQLKRSVGRGRPAVEPTDATCGRRNPFHHLVSCDDVDAHTQGRADQRTGAGGRANEASLYLGKDRKTESDDVENVGGRTDE